MLLQRPRRLLGWRRLPPPPSGCAAPTIRLQLSLEDDQGSFAHWVIPLPIKQVAKRAIVLWRLPAASTLGILPCVESGQLRLAPAQPGAPASLRTELAQGVLRLNFNDQLLHGYFRLHCLPEGGGQLWQLTPIGQV